MSILDYFRPDPTRDWPESRPVALVYDLVRRELNGIPAGAPFERLRPFGRPGNKKPLREQNFCYPRLGVEIGLISDSVDAVACVFLPKPGDSNIEDHPEFRPCEIELRLAGGERVRLTADAVRDDVERQLGPLVLVRTPYDSALGIDLNGVWLGFEFDSGNRLYILDIEPARP
jgi:hypothetical protein